jgi:HSP20 family molecular chaperone IbpA
MYYGNFFSNTTYKFDNDTHVITIEAVGKTKDDVKIKAENNELHISIGKNGYKWGIPSDANLKKLKAVIKYGLLTISVPSKNESKEFEVEGD